MLTNEQLGFYHEQGYLLVERMFTLDEAAALRKECHELATRLAAERNIDATWGSAREVNAHAQTTAVLHCHDVQFYSAAFSRLLVDERLTGAAAAIIETCSCIIQKCSSSRQSAGRPSQCTRISRSSRTFTTA